MVDAAKLLLKRSHVTKAVASIMWILKSGTDVGQVRADVAVELKALRAKGLQEKDVFPAVLVTAVARALAMRKPSGG